MIVVNNGEMDDVDADALNNADADVLVEFDYVKTQGFRKRAKTVESSRTKKMEERPNEEVPRVAFVVVM